MQAMRADTYVHVSLSKTYKGKPRRVPVWEMRYRLRSGKDSSRVLGPAWTSKGRPPHRRLTEQEALSKAKRIRGRTRCGHARSAALLRGRPEGVPAQLCA